MARIRLFKKAIHDLHRLDRWRVEEMELQPVGPSILATMYEYFATVDLRHYQPGAPIELEHEDWDGRMLLFPVNQGEPYKVYYRPVVKENLAEIRRIRHPRQKPIKRI